jgi:septal ring factor EnvC (AmiA/AmiB activator)
MIAFFLLMFLTVTASAQNPGIKPGVVTKIKINPDKWNQLSGDYTQLQNELKGIKGQHAKIQAMLQELQSYNQKMKTFTSNLQNWEKQIDQAGVADQSQLLQATKQMQETQMSFNMQYLQLQNNMQNENRQFTMVSNIMKTKHDTVKNSISNIR